jgi:6-pyruvoyltetrahydropterin/6-carboxytetrahydropterin synthase
MFYLTKHFRFESAHRLANGYVGKCANIHGHSWNGHIEVIGIELDKQGLAVDFKDLGVYIKKIEETFDHAIILNESDVELVNFCVANGWLVKTIKGNPTCENLAKYIFEMLRHEMAIVNIHLLSVRIEETCTTSCTYKIS